MTRKGTTTPPIKLLVITYRRGAEEARGAHNSEVVGSKPTDGNLAYFYIVII